MPFQPSGRLGSLALALGLIVTLPAQASQTRTWTASDYADFEKGNLKNLSLRSDGLVTLAPQFQEIYDTSSAYLWALARDSKGNLYAGGGPGAKLYRLTSGGEKKTLADLDALEITAIAIDTRDRVYAATAPEGKVYRIAPDGKREIFYDPKSKYIWALAFDKAGNLLVATGDPGSVHRVAPDGHGTVLYQTDETHVRSMALDSAGNVILGTDPGGLVVRVSPSGQGFVLYQLAKSEVSAVAVAKDGTVYAAAVGSKQGASSAPPPAPVSAPAASASPAGGQLTLHAAAPPPLPSRLPAAEFRLRDRTFTASTPAAIHVRSGATPRILSMPLLSMPKAMYCWVPATKAASTASIRIGVTPRC